VRPAGIDVSSGVEQTAGVKDLVKLAALFAALAGVEV
jgi:phosphoribosylanthranilate isomerase